MNGLISAGDKCRSSTSSLERIKNRRNDEWCVRVCMFERARTRSGEGEGLTTAAGNTSQEATGSSCGGSYKDGEEC